MPPTGLHGDQRLPAASRAPRGCCAKNASSASRTTSASDRFSAKAMARRAACRSASIAANSVTGDTSFLSPTLPPRRWAPPLITRSVFMTDFLLIDDQVFDRSHELEIDGLLPNPLTQDITRVASHPLTRLCRVGQIHLDERQYIPVNDALVPP